MIIIIISSLYYFKIETSDKILRYFENDLSEIGTSQNFIASFYLKMCFEETTYQCFSQLEGKPKPIAPCTSDFSRALLHVIARNSDWFMAQIAPVVIGRSDQFGFGYSTVI